MKKMVVTLACVLIVPLAFAQTSSTGKGQKGQKGQLLQQNQ